MTATAQTILANLLENGSDWKVEKTSVEGVYVQKMPASKSKGASLCVVVNPPNDRGDPSKRRGLYIRTAKDIAFYKKAFSDPKMVVAFGVVVEANGGSVAEEAEEEIVITI